MSEYELKVVVGRLELRVEQLEKRNRELERIIRGIEYFGRSKLPVDSKLSAGSHPVQRTPDDDHVESPSRGLPVSSGDGSCEG